MTGEQATEQRKKAIKLLMRHGGTNARAEQVRRRLEGCATQNRCLSGACPECMRAYQRWFVTEVNTFLGAEKHPFRIVSVVPQHSIKEGDLK